jgi:hypothetical protein
MTSDAPQTGLVIRYQFLWPREHARGAEHGRKARPACVVVPLNVATKAVVLFPLTTQEPSPDRLFLRVPDTERQRLRLRGSTATWLLLDEANSDVLPGSDHIEPITHDPLVYAYGYFSQAFMRQVLRVLADAIRAKRLTIVRRPD